MVLGFLPCVCGFPVIIEQLCKNLKHSACFSHCTELIEYLYVLSDLLSQNDSSIKQELPGQ